MFLGKSAALANQSAPGGGIAAINSNNNSGNFSNATPAGPVKGGSGNLNGGGAGAAAHAKSERLDKHHLPF